MSLFPPDYRKDETNAGPLLAATSTMVSLATIFVGLRFYTRIRIVRALGLSDWLILLALLCSIGSTAGTIYSNATLPRCLALARLPLLIT